VPLAIFLIFAARISYTDIRSHRIHNRDVALFFLCEVATSPNIKYATALFSLFLTFYFLPAGLGFGDVKLSLPIGAAMADFSMDALVHFIAIMTVASAAHLLLEFLRKRSFATAIPLAPSIFIAACLQL
jgi:Flp pilus assembly protein protease CpaA